MRRFLFSRSLAVKAALVLAGISAGLAAGEVVVRFLEPPFGERYDYLDPPSGPNEHFRLTHDELGWEPIPGGTPGRDPFANNSLGFRDRPMKFEKGPETFRILVIGDSVAYGPGLNLDQTFDNRLEDLLSERLGKKVEAVNMGVPGYNSVQESILLKRRGLELEPDLVLVLWTTNDPGGTAVAVFSGGKVYTSIPGDVSMPIFLPLPIRWQLYLFRHSALFRQVCTRLGALYASWSPNGKVPVMDVYKGQNKLALLDMADMTASRGIGCLFVLFPAFDGGRESNDLLEETRLFLEREGLNYLDLREAFEGVPASELMRFEHDYIHPSARAADLAARFVVERLAGGAMPGPVFPSRRAPGPDGLKRSSEISLPERRIYHPAQELTRGTEPCEGIRIPFPDPEGDAAFGGPDIIGFAAATDGDRVCLLVHTQRQVSIGDRLVVQAGCSKENMTMTFERGATPEVTVQWVGGRKEDVQGLRVIRRDEVVLLEFPRKSLPPPFSKQEFKLGEVQSFSAGHPERVSDECPIVYTFGPASKGDLDDHEQAVR